MCNFASESGNVFLRAADAGQRDQHSSREDLWLQGDAESGDSTPLLEVVAAIGFTSVDGKLGMSQTITDGAAVWIHSREDGTGGLKVSTQFLYVDSSVLSAYQGSNAMEASANSYGGSRERRCPYIGPNEG